MGKAYLSEKHLLQFFLCMIILMSSGIRTANAAIKAGDATVKMNSTTTVSLADAYQRTLKKSRISTYRWSTTSSNITITSQSAYSATIRGVNTGTAKLNYYCSYYIDGYYRTMDFYYDVTISSGINGPTSLTISPTSVTLYEGETYNISATQTGAIGGTYFVSSNSDVVTVSTGSNSGYTTPGTITAVSEGTAYVYAKSMNGLTSSNCKVTVKSKTIAPTSIYLSPSTKSIEEGEYAYITANVSPYNATYSLKWTSSDTDIATVNSSGRVYGVKPGTAKITATVNGYGLYDYCMLTVTAKQVLATSVSVEAPETLFIGETYQLAPSCTPPEATLSFKYSVEDASVASVTSDGLISAVGKGTTNVVIIETISGLVKSVVVNVADPNIPDLTGDNEVTIADVTALVNIILGKTDGNISSKIADVNKDGNVSIADVTALVNIILGKM